MLAAGASAPIVHLQNFGFTFGELPFGTRSLTNRFSHFTVQCPRRLLFPCSHRLDRLGARSSCDPCSASVCWLCHVLRLVKALQTGSVAETVFVFTHVSFSDLCLADADCPLSIPDWRATWSVSIFLALATTRFECVLQSARSEFAASAGDRG